MPSEYRAALLLITLAVAGHLVRNLVTRPEDAPGDVQLLGSGGLSGPGDPKAQWDRVASASLPLRRGELIDVDRASASELARLPRVGLGLAKTIIADREAKGAFGSLQGLDRVPGVGSGLLRRLEGHVTFSGIESMGIRSSTAGPATVPRSAPLDINVASSAELERLPGIGPYMASQIVAYRAKHGAFSSVEDLVKVPGVGPATLTRIREGVMVR